jgi:hypothetical protein
MADIITSAGPDPAAEGNDLALDTISFYRPNQPGSYPIVLATYEIVCSKYPDSQVGTAAKAFLQSTIGAGQNGLADNWYVPIRTGSSRDCRPRSTPSRDLTWFLARKLSETGLDLLFHYVRESSAVMGDFLCAATAESQAPVVGGLRGPTIGRSVRVPKPSGRPGLTIV